MFSVDDINALFCLLLCKSKYNFSIHQLLLLPTLLRKNCAEGYLVLTLNNVYRLYIRGMYVPHFIKVNFVNAIYFLCYFQQFSIYCLL